MKRYFAKANSWFKEGTECFREIEMFPPNTLTDGKTGEKTGSAIYRGIYVVGSCNPNGYDKIWYNKGYKDGDEMELHELCTDSEFDVLEE